MRMWMGKVSSWRMCFVEGSAILRSRAACCAPASKIALIQLFAFRIFRCSASCNRACTSLGNSSGFESQKMSTVIFV